MDNKRPILLIWMFLLFVSSTAVVFSQDIEIEGFVNDYADIINPEQEQELRAVLKQIYDSGTAQYAIVTVDSLGEKDIESYSIDLAQGNLGDSEKNNGLLLLVAVEDRKYRFEVGRGIEYILNDAKVGRIGRYYLVPNFQEEKYGEGIVEASYTMRSILLGDNESEYYISDEETQISQENISEIVWFVFMIFLFVILPLLGAFLRHRKSDNKYFDAAMGAVILFGGRGGRGGFGGNGGGFGGFGGGGFGGGGASGGW